MCNWTIRIIEFMCVTGLLGLLGLLYVIRTTRITGFIMCNSDY